MNTIVLFQFQIFVVEINLISSIAFRQIAKQQSGKPSI